jgi:hypothetical protein
MQWNVVALSTLLASGAAFAADFSHDSATDFSGTYHPRGTLKAGRFELFEIALAMPDDFKKWETGKTHKPEDSPIGMVFHDLSGKHFTDGAGVEEYANSPVVAASGYSIKGNTLSFRGNDKQLGLVTFTGTFDMKAMKATAAGGDPARIAPVLTGDLTVGGKTYKNIRFESYGDD